MKPTATSVDALKTFPFFRDEAINDLKLELPTYLAAADGTPREVNPLEWWEHNKVTLPKWSRGFCRVVLVQPSSASVERVFFSILKRHFTQPQQSALQDYIEVGVMLEFNNCIINNYCCTFIVSLCSQNVAIMLNYAQVRVESYYAQIYAGIMC